MNNGSAGTSRTGRGTRALAAGVVVFALSLVAGLATYQALMHERVLYGVTLGGERYGATDFAEAPARIAAHAARLEQQPLTVHGMETAVTLFELGISLNVDQATADIMSAGREGNLLGRLWSGASLLLDEVAVPWQLESSVDTNDRLAALVSRELSEPNDARLMLVGGEVAVVEHQLGRAVDLETTLVELAAAFAAGEPREIRIRTMTVLPELTRDDLRTIRHKAQTVIARPVQVNIGRHEITIDEQAVLDWIRPVRHVDGSVGMTYDEAAIHKTLDSVASSSIDVAATPKKVSSIDGSVINAGTAGWVLNREQASTALATALAQQDDAPIAITANLVRVEPPVERVRPRTTVVAGTAGLFEGKYVEVDLSSQVLYQYEGTELIGHYAVSTGKWSSPTPIGTYSINFKHPRAYSASYGLYMPYWMAFIGTSYGLHALPEWPSGYKEGESHLGTPVSHGCVRLGTGQAATLYEWMEIGTPVVIHH